MYTIGWKEQKLNPLFPLDPAEIFCNNSTCFFFQIWRATLLLLPNAIRFFQLGVAKSSKPSRTWPALYSYYCRGGGSVILDASAWVRVFIKNRQKSSRKECYIKLWILFSSGCLDLENATHFIQRNGGHTVVMVAPPLPNQPKLHHFPRAAWESHKFFFCWFFRLISIFIFAFHLSLSLSSITVIIVIRFLASLLFDWSGLWHSFTTFPFEFSWKNIQSRRRWTCALIMEISTVEGGVW